MCKRKHLINGGVHVSVCKLSYQSQKTPTKTVTLFSCLPFEDIAIDTLIDGEALCCSSRKPIMAGDGPLLRGDEAYAFFVFPKRNHANSI